MCELCMQQSREWGRSVCIGALISRLQILNGWQRQEGVWWFSERERSGGSLSRPLPLQPPHFHRTAIKVNRHFAQPLLLCSLSLSLTPFLSFSLFPLAPTCTVCFAWAQLHRWYKPKYLQHKYWQWKPALLSNGCAGKGDRIISQDSPSFSFLPILSQPSVLVLISLDLLASVLF